MLKSKDKDSAMQFMVKLPYNLKKEGDWYVSSCNPLDVFSQGKTKDEATENLREALQIFLSTCYEMGTLDAVFKECGFTLMPNVNKVEKSISKKHLLEVTLNFFSTHNGFQACHA